MKLKKIFNIFNIFNKTPKSNPFKPMTFKDFSDWYEDKIDKGYLDYPIAFTCRCLIRDLSYNHHFWEIERVWQRNYREHFVNEIVNPTNEKIKSFNKTKEKEK